MYVPMSGKLTCIADRFEGFYNLLIQEQIADNLQNIPRLPQEQTTNCPITRECHGIPLE